MFSSNRWNVRRWHGGDPPNTIKKGRVKRTKGFRADKTGGRENDRQRGVVGTKGKGVSNEKDSITHRVAAQHN